MAKGLELSSLDSLSRQEADQFKRAGTRAHSAGQSELCAEGLMPAVQQAREARLQCSCPGASLTARMTIQSNEGKMRSYPQFMRYVRIRETSNGF